MQPLFEMAKDKSFIRYTNTNFYPAVLIVTYNHEQYLTQAIESVLNQIGNIKFSLFISDDCSTDNTKNIIKFYTKQYPNLIYDISPEKHIGLSENYRQSIAKIPSSYTHIAILEGDDWWELNKLKQVSTFIVKYPKLPLIYNTVKYYNIKANYDQIYTIDTYKFDNAILLEEDVLNCVYPNLIHNLSTCILDINVAKNFPTELYDNYRFSEVPLLYYIIKNYGKVGKIDLPLSIWRLHSNGAWSGLSYEEKKLSAYKCFYSAYCVASDKCKKKLFTLLSSYAHDLVMLGYKDNFELNLDIFL